MPVTPGTIDTNNKEENDHSTNSKSYVIDYGGVNRALSIEIVGRRDLAGSGKVSSVTVDGINAVLEVADAEVNDKLTEIWILDDANLPGSAGSYTVAVSFDDDMDWSAVTVINLTYVDQTILGENTNTDARTNTSHPISVVCNDEDDLCLAIASIDTSAANISNRSGDTRRSTLDYASGTRTAVVNTDNGEADQLVHLGWNTVPSVYSITAACNFRFSDVVAGADIVRVVDEIVRC